MRILFFFCIFFWEEKYFEYAAKYAKVNDYYQGNNTRVRDSFVNSRQKRNVSEK
jgi:hypothetical protein